jgi:SAM-dependent methyltransferase
MNESHKIDWAAAWIARDKTRNISEASYWNARADSFTKKAGHSTYAQTFLEFANIPAGQTVLDMGCGGGTLALPLARLGHHVIAADFSDGMLDALKHAAQQEGLTTIQTIKLDWNQSWQEWQDAGITPGCVDVAIASRSTIVHDLGEALYKLSQAARSKVCITSATDSGPKSFPDLFTYLGRSQPKLPDFIFALNLLLQWGLDPELRYIDSRKPDAFDSRGDALAYYHEYIDALTPSEEKLLEAYLDKHAKTSAHKPGIELDITRLIRWAFISWNPTVLQQRSPRW